MKTVIKEAMDMAKKVHEGDIYNKNEDYYTHHLAEAAKFLDKSLKDKLKLSEKKLTDITVAVYLHDTVEDHPDEVTLSDISDKFGSDVADIVDRVSRRENEPYAVYMMRILGRVESTVVKMCDLAINIAASYRSDKMNSYARQRLGKYEVAYMLVAAHLEKEEVLNLDPPEEKK